jgi:deoxyribose-phosphate aldolase
MILNGYIDHTLLKPDATETQIDQVVQEAKENHFASVMVNPYWVVYVHEKLTGTQVHTATVIGFPLGANTTYIKAKEAKKAMHDGADELDIVINIGELKTGNTEAIRQELTSLARTIHEKDKIMKVIIETALLTDDEISLASQLVADSGADFVKTSTGFSTRGASVHDIELMKKAVNGRAQLKASGGIHTAEEAEAMINAGATRLGVSASMAIIGKV